MTPADEPLDDQEGDIADDPVLAPLDREVGAVLRYTDNRLLVFIGIALAAIYLPDRLHLPAPVTTIFAVAGGCLLLGGIAFTVFSAVRGQQRVAARYGLICPRCGRGPRTTHILATADLGRCHRCHHPLEVRRSASPRGGKRRGR